MKILLVEDEPHVASSLKLGLGAEGFIVVHVATGTEGLWEATEKPFRCHRFGHHGAGVEWV